MSVPDFDAREGLLRQPGVQARLDAGEALQVVDPEAQPSRAWRVGRAIATGTVWINTYKQFSISTPFGGVKDSGLGREKGRDGVRAYMEQKSLYLDTSARPHPWAAPSLESRP